MAQFFNFKEDYFGLNDKEVDRNTELYGLNIYTKKDINKTRKNTRSKTNKKRISRQIHIFRIIQRHTRNVGRCILLHRLHI